MGNQNATLQRVILPKKKGDPPQPVEDKIPVQFNPETLTVTYANQIGGDNQKGSSTQLAATGTSRLTLELWFDTTVPMQDGEAETYGDVRKLTDKVAALMRPSDGDKKKDAKAAVAGVEFHWGNFIFDGVMESLTEKLEYFSAEGVPLRANLSVSLAAQELLTQKEFGSGAGSQPLQAAKAGDSLPQMAAKQGISDWKSIAEAAGIENPRILPAGTLLNMSPSNLGKG
ncbi:MAG: hypothetical protein ACM3XM_05525 [Mycobacterium leprae]